MFTLGAAICSITGASLETASIGGCAAAALGM